MNEKWVLHLARWSLLLATVLAVIACGRNDNSLAVVADPEQGTAVAQSTPAEPQATAPAEPTAAETPSPAAQIASISVAVNAEFKPFVYVDEAGTLTGFDIDLMNALAQAGGFEVGFVDRPFEGLLDAVAAGEFDAAISAITITDARREQVDFTEPYFAAGQAPISYFNAGQGMAVRTDNTTITGRDSLTSSVTVGVKQETTGASFVTEQTEAQVETFAEAEPALQALAQGDVEAVVLDIPVIVNYIKAHADAGIKLVGGPITDEQYGIAVTKTEPEVLTALNDALETVRRDGTYDAIVQKWFGAP